LPVAVILGAFTALGAAALGAGLAFAAGFDAFLAMVNSPNSNVLPCFISGSVPVMHVFHRENQRLASASGRKTRIFHDFSHIFAPEHDFQAGFPQFRSTSTSTIE
jgi:hypothetical protein